MEKIEQSFEQEHFFVTHRSCLDTSLIRIICSFKHSLTVFRKNCSKTRCLMLQMEKWWQMVFFNVLFQNCGHLDINENY